jgi:hypothetical protein
MNRIAITGTLLVLLNAGLAGAVRPLAAQTFPTDNPVLKAIWAEGMENSRAYPLAQALMDSIGPRLTGTPGHHAANEWAVSMFKTWGVPARNEEYGTWVGWRRGISHIDLVSPRVRSLDGMMLAWSPGTGGAVEAAAVALPWFEGSDELGNWLPTVNGKFVLVGPAESSCRPSSNWEEFATGASFEAHQAARQEAQAKWRQQVGDLGGTDSLIAGLEGAGAAGVITSSWSSGWGARRIFSADTKAIPTVDLGCEDYGLVYRLAQHGQNPVLRIEAEAEFLGEVPVFNTIAELRGSELPNEYILLGAHLDSWDGGSGATDNGTGTVTMMEAMRILKAVYPNPRRTILVGLWGAEEQGLIGSRAFNEDHQEVMDGLQAAFNQDNGTGRVTGISMQGLTGAGSHFGHWLSLIPGEITGHIDLSIPGSPSGGGSDHASFVCEGAPSFMLGSLNWGYFQYTWHTNLDTFDKVVFDDVKNNAVLTAMLAYLASEDAERIPRDRRVMPLNPRTGEQREWPVCRPARRSWDGS